MDGTPELLCPPALAQVQPMRGSCRRSDSGRKERQGYFFLTPSLCQGLYHGSGCHRAPVTLMVLLVPSDQGEVGTPAQLLASDTLPGTLSTLCKYPLH